jgi:hypothetical protein
LADNPDAKTVYTTFHPSDAGILPLIKKTQKRDYVEHLLDGTYVLHNPFARRPIPPGVLSHSRLAEVRVASDGKLLTDCPNDFLLVRTLMSVREHD